jgi:hypothetical protein
MRAERNRAWRLKHKREHYEHEKKIKELRKSTPKYKITKQQALERIENEDQEF